MLNLTLLKMRLPIFEYLAMFKYLSISKWQFNSTLANFFSLADYLLIKLISEVSFYLSHTIQIATQIVEFSPNANTFTNKFQKLCYIKTQSANTMAYRFDIKKQ